MECMKENTGGETCKMCRGLLPVYGGHIIILDDITIKVCEVCFKNVVNVCIDKVNRGLHNGG